MEVQIDDYLEKLSEYKKPLFLHEIDSLIKEILKEIRVSQKGDFLLFQKNFLLNSHI